jgi:hypothetical protein
MTESQVKACWWSTEGFATGIEPDAYTEMPSGRWEEVTRRAGYEQYASFGEEFDALRVDVYFHRVQLHLLVSIGNENGGLTHFFVKERDQSAFFALWYVKFLRDAALIKQAEAICKIVDTYER